MTVQHDHTGATPECVRSIHRRPGGRNARNEASNVASTAAGGAREVADEAGAQAKAVAGEAKQQLDRLISQGRDEVRQQAEQRSSQAAGQLRTLSEQFSALVQGRPEAAGPLVGYASDLQSQLRRLATRMEQGGPQGVIEDVTRLRPAPPGCVPRRRGGRRVRRRPARAGRRGEPAGERPVDGRRARRPHRTGPTYEEPSPLPPPARSAGSAP